MKYSVIIPAYNIEKHCHSILNFIEKTKKTRSDIEYIIINDGSTDNTGEILSLYSGFTYIHNINRGVSFSRNLGIQVATGDYILFLDADDSYHYEIFDILDVEINKSKNNDIYIFNYSINENIVNNHVVSNGKHSSYEILRLFLRHKLNIHICSICFKKQFIIEQGIRFPDNYKFGEDIYFILSSLISTKINIYYIDRSIFNYNWDNSTTVKSPITKNKIDVIDLYHFLEKNSKITDKRIIKDIVYFKQRTFFYLLKLSFKFNIEDKETLDYLFNKKNILKGDKNSLYPVILLYYLFEKSIYRILNKKIQRLL